MNNQSNPKRRRRGLVNRMASHRLSRRANRRGGFTLLEVLLVMAILIILMSLVGVGYFSYFAGGQEDAARMQISTLENAVKGFYLKTGKYPQKLDDLVQMPSGMSDKQWKGPHLDAQQVPMDPWGNQYQLQINSNGNARQTQIIISSPGPNGIAGDQDDVSNMADNQTNT